MEALYRYPTTAEELKELLRVLSPQLAGEVKFETTSTTWSVSPGGVVSYWFYVTPEWVDIEPKAVEVFSDYYSDKIVVDVYSDGVWFTMARLVAPLMIDFGSYFIKRRNIQVSVWNQLTDRTITFTLVRHIGLVSVRVYRDIILPRLDKLKRLVEVGRPVRV